MKSKRLLLTLLLALFVPWAANAQSPLTVCNGTDNSQYVPFEGYNADAAQHNQMIFPATILSEMSGKSITQMVFYIDANANNSTGSTYTAPGRLGTWTVSLGETTATTLTALDNTTAVTQVYEGNFDCSTGTLTLAFDNEYVYHGGNLLVDLNHAASGWARWYFLGVNQTGNTAITRGTLYKFLPKTSFSYQTPSCCSKPTNLTCTGTTGTPATATFTWTNGGEETQWLLEYALDENFTNPTQVTVNQSDLVNGAYTLNGLTAETKYYARIKAWCPSCGAAGEYSDASNTCPFKPTNAFCNDIGTGTESANLVYTSWGCTYSQHIYTADELTDMGFSAGDIVSVSFYYSGSSSSYQKTQSIYMGTTTKSSYSGGNATDFESDVTLVYGPTLLSYVAGWREYELTEPYCWDGASNIVVGMLTNSTATSSSGWSAYGTSTSPDYRTIYRYRDSNPIDITDLASVSNGTRSTTRPNIHLCIVPSPTPKPTNLHVVDGSLWSGGATLAWEAPASATPTSYQYCYKTDASAWSAWESTTELSVALNLAASTHYTFQVKAIYDGVGESAAVETDFTTLDDCAFPTNLLAYTVPGQGTKATLTWVKGYDEENWVLQYGTDPNFTNGTYTEMTSGFIPQTDPELVNVVAAVLNGLTPETHFYARVKATCSATSSSTWSNVVDFTPTNYVDYTFNENATSNSSYSYIPFRGSYVAYQTNSQFIIPATSLADVAGGTVKRLTFYSATPTVDWGDATFKVYVAEVDNTTFASNPTSFDWSAMDEVYSGSLSVANGQMVIVLDQTFYYSGDKNLMIGFEKTAAGTNASVAWIYNSVSNTCAYSYTSSATGTLTYSRSGYLPKLTFNYLPTPYQKIAAINEGTITTNTAELTWTAPETTATITGYYYQYKLSSAAEWPTGWHNLDANTTSVTLGGDLIPGTFYDFRIKVLYEGNHESAVTSTSFNTQCGVVTAFPWKEDFETYAAGNFSHPCWVNEHISGEGAYIFNVYTSTNGNNTTHQLQLPDQTAGTETMLRLPEMNLPNNAYQFVIDVYRNTSTFQEYPYELEGVYVYVSTDGNIEGATELAYIPRHREVSNAVIPAEEENGWYTYELPIGISGDCYIILKGVNQYCTSIYMDNFSVEEIPSCARPTDLAKSEVTNHSATLTWTAGDPDQHNWQVAYSKTSFDPNTANFDLTTVETVDFTTGATCTYRMDKLFDAESTYYLYIRANCGTATEPDYGPWSRKGISLTTLAASPAPSNFTASNFGSQTADLVWTAGGGDYELSWDLYYVQSDDAPTAPTEETPATKTVSTLPTTENPYTLDGLREESRYYIWVRANHTINSVTTHSAWVALTGNFFTTLAACPTPTGLAYNNLTAVSADLSWVGSPDVTDYTVQYRTSAGMSTTVLSEHFDVSGVPTGWTKYTGLVDEVIDGTVTLSSTTSGWNTNTYALGTYNMKVNVYGSSCKYWLVTPEIELGTGNVLNFDLALTDYGNANVIEYPTQQPDDRFVVLVYADDAWHILREWNNSGSEYVYNTIATAGENVTIALSLYSGKTVKIAFYGESTVAGASSGVDDNDLHIDNVEVGTPTDAGEWITAVDDVETQSYQLTGLTGGVKYDVHVKSNCTSGEYCPEISFTTLADGTKVFVTAGEWGTATNWMPNGAPVITDEVILRANATIESGCVAQAKQITFQGSPTPTLTINDGGQLQTDNTVTATVKKNIEHWTVEGVEGSDTEKPNGYYFISNPLNSTIYSSSFASIGLTTTNSDYDLYRWSTGEGADYLEWRNFKASSFNLQGGGYLYANAADVVLTFTGTVRANNERSGWTPTQASYSFGNWNLYGNPFVCNAYLVNSNNISKPYYKMNEAGDGFEAVIGEAIPPVTGFFYDASESGESVFFTRDLPAMSNQGHLNINLAQNVNMRGAKGSTDNAIIVFGESQQMGKFSFREGSSKVYIPMEGKDYAVVNAEGKTGEIPVSFKAEKNGSYTLSFTSQEVTFSYLHLIDNLTGNDVDLLANPNYSFDAQTTDYAQRFRLVFATGSSVDGDSFAFINGMGNLSIFGIEGTATVQVMDVTGRILSSETFSGSYEKSLNVAPGVYMIRLINGNDVKVQKMIVK